MLKKAAIFLFAVVTVMVMFPITLSGEAEYETEDFKYICGDESGELYAAISGVKKGEFFYCRKADGKIWYSNPQNSENQKLSDDEKSQLSFRIYNKASNSIRQVSSYAATNRGKNIIVKKNKNGFTSEYKINNTELAIKINVELTNGMLKVSSDLKKNLSDGKSYLTGISVLPYFGCTKSGTNGYTLVPDGSGALIYNNAAKETTYSQRIYGTDLAFATDLKQTLTEKALFPVYGVKTDTGSLFAIAESGKASATLNVKNNSKYNIAYYYFELIGNDSMDLGESGSGYKIVNDIYAYNMPLTDKIEICYTFFGAGTEYDDMAEYYKNYLNLKKNHSLSKNDPSLYLELYGGLNKNESFAGIPLMRFKKLTTAEQALEICKYFTVACGYKPLVIYRNADSAIINNKIQSKFSFKKSLGSLKTLEKLKDTIDNRLYLENDIFSAGKSGNGFSKFRQSCIRINRKNVIYKYFDPATTNADMSIRFSYAVKPTALKKIQDKYITSINKAGFKSAVIGLTDSPYSDFSQKKYTSRAETIKIFESILKGYNESILYSPADYAVGYSDIVTDAPTSSSNYDSEFTDVPFYELVLSGTKEYSVESINLYSNVKTGFLKAIESGASLKFTLVYDNITDIKNTYLDSLHGAEFGSWKTTISDYQNQISKIYDELGSRVIKKHFVISPEIRMTVYDGGKAVVVNYSDSDIKTEFGTIPAYGYSIVKGQANNV